MSADEPITSSHTTTLRSLFDITKLYLVHYKTKMSREANENRTLDNYCLPGLFAKHCFSDEVSSHNNENSRKLKKLTGGGQSCLGVDVKGAQIYVCICSLSVA